MCNYFISLLNTHFGEGMFESHSADILCSKMILELTCCLNIWCQSTCRPSALTLFRCGLSCFILGCVPMSSPPLKKHMLSLMYIILIHSDPVPCLLPNKTCFYFNNSKTTTKSDLFFYFRIIDSSKNWTKVRLM